MKTNNFNITELIGNNKIPDYNYAMHIVIGIAWIISFKNNVDVRNIAIPSTLELPGIEDYLNNIFQRIESETKKDIEDIHNEYRAIYLNMKSKLIILEGKTDAGKTTVLKDVIRKLKLNESFETTCSIELPESTKNKMEKWDDEIVTLRYKANSKTITIFTMGDWPEDIAYVIAESKKEDFLLLGVNTSHFNTRALNDRLVFSNRFSKIKVKEIEKNDYNKSLVTDIVNRIICLLNE